MQILRCYFSPSLQKIKTLDKTNKQDKWRSEFVYNYIQDYFIKPDFVIGITEYMDTKIESILAYTSQFENPKTPNPNSITGLLNQIKSTNIIFGRQINTTNAKGFTVNKYTGVDDLYQLK